MKFTPETMARIEASVPIEGSATAIDVWKSTGGLSHQHVKNGLKALYEAGKVVRRQEQFKANSKSRTRSRFLYQRVGRP